MMQTVFYNARIITLNKKEPSASAMLVNDGSIVFVGSNEEVLNLKQEDTELVDLNKKLVLPTFFDGNCQVYDLIEDGLKNAKKFKHLELFDENDEYYEKFTNFEVYKTEFLKLQEEFLKLGITTIQELDITPAEFVFWKKMAEENLLKIDVIGYVDMLSSKKVMDDNCRSYRKYKNHFRLGGYSLTLDGDLFKKKAWFSKAYKKEKGYCGYAEIFDEQLSYLIKTALEEKKQLLVKASGDRAVSQFIKIFEEVVEKEKVEDKFKPVILNAGFLSKANITKMKKLDILPSFQIEDVTTRECELVKCVGLRRAKCYQNYVLLKNQEIDFLIQNSRQKIFNAFESLSHLMTQSRLHKKQNVLTIQEALDALIISASIRAFDGEQKGTLESGKNADFLVLDSTCDDLSDAKVQSVYLKGEKIK